MYFAKTLGRVFLSVSMSAVFWQFYLLIFVHSLCAWLTKLKLNTNRTVYILDELINVSRSREQELRRKPLNTEYTIFHCSHIMKFNRFFFSLYGGELSHHKNHFQLSTISFVCYIQSSVINVTGKSNLHLVLWKRNIHRICRNSHGELKYLL